VVVTERKKITKLDITERRIIVINLMLIHAILKYVMITMGKKLMKPKKKEIILSFMNLQCRL